MIELRKPLAADLLETRSSVLQSPAFLFLLAFVLIGLAFEVAYVYSLMGGHYDVSRIDTLIYLNAYNFILFFLLPLLFGRFLFQANYRELGLALPAHYKQAVLLSLLALAMLLPWMCYFAKLPAFHANYPGHWSLSTFLIMQFAIAPFYYFCEEFFFRGFLFTGFFKKVGWHSFWITDILFVYAHLYKPGLEILASIPASIILNFLTLRTKSIYPALIVHYILGVTLNTLFYLRTYA
jgi:membrane protease YdiL (CAAX protease family)